MAEKVQIGDYSITTELRDPSSIVPRPSSFVINTLNTHSWVVAEKDQAFKEALLASDCLLPDGEGIVWAVKHVTGKKIRKIAGYDLFIFMLEYLQRTGGTCFFLGGSPATLELIRERLSREYPGVRAGFYSPPFKEAFDEEDNDKINYELRKTNDELNSRISNYENSSPLTAHRSPMTVLFVGMTAPKQEKWVFQNRERIPADIVCSIGAVFDFYAGTGKRPPAWMVRSKLEWLGRLISCPKKIWKRVFLSGPRFFISVLKLK